MTKEKLNLSEDVSKLESREEVALDQQNQLKTKLTELELQRRKTVLDIEAERLNRIKKNSDRRPWAFSLAGLTIGVLYIAFIVLVTKAVCAFASLAPQVQIALIFALAATPTILAIALLKAVFARTSKSAESPTLADATPVKKIIDAAIDD